MDGPAFLGVFSRMDNDIFNSIIVSSGIVLVTKFFFHRVLKGSN
jgi:hypothetical protein